MASTTSSSQSQAGFFSQASKLVNSVLGGSKKTKPEVKSLQLAAQAAKKVRSVMTYFDVLVLNTLPIATRGA